MVRGMGYIDLRVLWHSDGVFRFFLLGRMGRIWANYF